MGDVCVWIDWKIGRGASAHGRVIDFTFCSFCVYFQRDLRDCCPMRIRAFAQVVRGALLFSSTTGAMSPSMAGVELEWRRMSPSLKAMAIHTFIANHDQPPTPNISSTDVHLTFTQAICIADRWLYHGEQRTEHGKQRTNLKGGNDGHSLQKPRHRQDGHT